MNPTPPSSPHALTDAMIEALLLDTTPWLSCEECFARMDTYAEAMVRDGQHPDPGMARHLQGCGACHEEADSLIALLVEDRQ